jgi:hypothetical protein
MSRKNPIDDLLNKKMSRKDFLAHIGLAAAGVVGVSAAMKNLSELGRNKSRPKRQANVAPRGFGGGKYGA